MRIKTNEKAGCASRQINTFCAGFAIMAGLFGHAAYAQATAALVHLDGLSCSTSAGFGTFTAISWSVTTDATQKVPPVITFTKALDACSAALYRAFTAPKAFRAKAASITVRDSKGTQLEYIGFANASITGYSLNGGSSIPTESVTLALSDLTIQWQ